MKQDKAGGAEEKWEEKAVMTCVDPRHKFRTSTHTGAGPFALIFQLPGRCPVLCWSWEMGQRGLK